MISLLKNLKFLLIALTLTFASSASSKSINIGDKEVQTVSSFYELLSKDKKPLDKLLSLSQPELQRVFNSEMTRLILDEAKCVQDGFVCGLDFDPLFGSQDPSPKNITFSKISNKVVVSFSERGKRKIISYIFSTSNSGYRVSDVIYPRGLSLKKLLSSN
jgi:hypothetical protein